MFDQLVLVPIINNIANSGETNAFCIGGRSHTYKKFGQRIAAIRRALKEYRGLGNLVGLIANDDLNTYASILAIWLEGMAYVPLHPKQPKERNANVIGQAGLALILDSELSSDFGYIEIVRTKLLEDLDGPLSPKEVAENELAYILFTSGSTGAPKGVPISRKNLASFYKSFVDTGIVIEAKDKCLQCFDLTFDVSIQAFVVPLVAGAVVYTIPHDKIKYVYIYELLMEQRLTVAVMPPSMIRYLKPYFDEISVPEMRYCILTAEASPAELIREWQTRIPSATILDFYGPTEATIYCTYYRVPSKGEVKQSNGMIAIGKPMPGVQAILINDGVRVGVGEKGELCVSTNQLTVGYWKNSAKTEEVFFVLQENGLDVRYYKTGDLCILDEEGDLLYLGRKDYQVKIQGYRVELGEIEYHARAALNGLNAIAMVSSNDIGNTELVLFVEGIASNEVVLRRELSLKIPNYMIPSRFVFLERFPLNSSDKVDRNMLKSMI